MAKSEIDWAGVMRKVRIRVVLGLAFNKWMQAELAREAGVCAGTISRLVNGHSRNMYVSTLYRLARALKVSPNWLLGIPKRKMHQLRETRIISLSKHKRAA